VLHPAGISREGFRHAFYEGRREASGLALCLPSLDRSGTVVIRNEIAGRKRIAVYQILYPRRPGFRKGIFDETTTRDNAFLDPA